MHAACLSPVQAVGACRLWVRPSPLVQVAQAVLLCEVDHQAHRSVRLSSQRCATTAALSMTLRGQSRWGTPAANGVANRVLRLSFTLRLTGSPCTSANAERTTMSVLSEGSADTLRVVMNPVPEAAAGA